MLGTINGTVTEELLGIKAVLRSHSGTCSARSDENNDGDLITDTLNTAGAASVTVSFWLYHTDVSESNDDLLLYFRDNLGNWDEVANLANYGWDNTWSQYSLPTTNSQYLHSNFAVRIDSNLGNSEYVYIDDVLITRT